MTFRAKPDAKRTHRPAYQTDTRRTLLLNLGFGLVVLLALLILAGAAAASWYGDHLQSIASVNGQSITKDDFRDRALVDAYRLDYQETLVRQRVQDGKLDDTSAQTIESQISQARSTLENDSLEHLIDATLMQQLAAKQGVAITDQQVDAQVTKDATRPESRHLWVIGAKPEVTSPATTPTDAQKAAAKARADKALADLKGGVQWADVAKTMADDVYSSKGGDAGWFTKEGNVLDPKLNDALFSLPVNGLTDVIEGADGVFRIGRVSEIDQQTVDPAFQQKLKDQGISADAYRKVARADAVKQALDDKIVADATAQPTVQRHVAEIYLALDPSVPAGTGDEVKVRHILFSPNDDPQGAQSLVSTDPAWKKAKDEADATYALLQKDPSQFEALAKNNSDDAGTKADGGALPYYTKSNLDPAFANAIFQDGLQKDQILAPVKSSFGYHIIQFIDRRKQAPDRIAAIKTQAEAPGADFAALAKANSEAPNKDQGGDAGWVAKYQMDTVREIAIFKAQVGGLTDVITLQDGVYLYKVLEEQTRMPDQAQIDDIKSNGFTNWYVSEKNAAHIERPSTSPGTTVPAVQ